MKFLFIALFTVLISTSDCFCQNENFKLSGEVADSLNLVKIESATVNLADRFESKSTKTDSTGCFHFNGLKPGEYNLTITSIGYKAFKKKIILYADSSLSIKLNFTSFNLTEVVVKDTLSGKQKLISQIDRLIIRPAKDLLESSVSSLDVIKTIPLIAFTGDQIKLKGKSNILIFINGQRSSFERLRVLSPKTIQNIEIIPYPPVQYSEYDGIINVVLKKAAGASSYEGFLNGTAGNRNAIDGLASLGFRKNGFYINGTVQYNQVKTVFNNTATIYNLLTNNSRSQYGDKIVNQHFNYAGLSASYNLKSDLFNIDANTFLYSFDRTNHYEILNNQLSDTTFDSNSKKRAVNTTLNYKHTFKSHSEFQLSFKNKSSFNEDKVLSNSNDENNYENTLLIDYSQLSTKISWNAGLKYINRTIQSSFVNGTVGSLSSRQDVPSLYSSMSFKLRKVSFRLSGQLFFNDYSVEYNNAEIYAFKKLHFSPVLLISKNVTTTSSIKFSYNNRLITPGIYYVNPYFDNSDIITAKQGNPQIRPENQHTFNIEYSKSTTNDYFLISADELFIQHKIVPLISINNSSVISSFINSSYKESSINTYYSKTINQKHTLTGSFTLLYSSISGQGYNNNLFNYNYSISFNYNLFKKAYLNFSSNHYAPEVRLQGKQTTMFYNAISYQQSLFHGLAFSLKTNYPFNIGTKQTSDLTLPNYQQTTYSSLHLQTYQIGISYNFGKTNSTKASSRPKGINNSDIKDKSISL